MAYLGLHGGNAQGVDAQGQLREGGDGGAEYFVVIDDHLRSAHAWEDVVEQVAVGDAVAQGLDALQAARGLFAGEPLFAGDGLKRLYGLLAIRDGCVEARELEHALPVAAEEGVFLIGVGEGTVLAEVIEQRGCAALRQELVESH